MFAPFLLVALISVPLPSGEARVEPDPDPFAGRWVRVDSIATTANVRRGDRQRNGDVRYRIQWTVELEPGQLATFEIPNAPGFRDYPAQRRRSPWECSGLNVRGSEDPEVRQQTNLAPSGPSLDGALQNESTGARTCHFTLYQDSRGRAPFASAFPITTVTYVRLIPPNATASELLQSLTGKVGPGALGIRGPDWVYTMPEEGGESYRLRAPVHALLGAHSHEGALVLVCVNGLPCWTGDRGETGSLLPTEGAASGGEFDLISGRIMEVRRRVLNEYHAPGSDDIRIHAAALNANLDRFSQSRYTLSADADGWWIQPYGQREGASRAPLDGLEFRLTDSQIVLHCADGTACIQPSAGAPTSRVVLDLYDDAPVASMRERFVDMQRLAPTAHEREVAGAAADRAAAESTREQDRLLDDLRQQAEANAAEARADMAQREAETDPPAPLAEPVQWHTMEGVMDGTETEFTLAPGRTGPAVPYELELQAGTVLHVRLAASGFDPYLTLYSPDGIAVHNDDLGLGLDAGFAYEVTETAQYVLLAGATLADATGTFTLRLRTEAP